MCCVDAGRELFSDGAKEVKSLCLDVVVVLLRTVVD